MGAWGSYLVARATIAAGGLAVLRRRQIQNPPWLRRRLIGLGKRRSTDCLVKSFHRGHGPGSPAVCEAREYC
jgi:hypothetical protein